jgi:hypothetical protein
MAVMIEIVHHQPMAARKNETQLVAQSAVRCNPFKL